MRHILYIVIALLLPASALAIDVTVRIEGLDRALEANARAFLSVEQDQSNGGLTRSRLRLLHKRAPQEIRQALQPFGYFEPTIESSINDEEGHYEVLYKVDAGPQVALEAVDFQVTGEGARERLLTADFPLAKGDGLDLARYDKAKQSRLSLALELGYLDAHYTVHEVRVDRQSNTARIKLLLETGMRFQFGEIRMSQEILDPEFLGRYLSFGAGDPYSQDKLLDLQSKLIDSEYFKQVEVNVRRDQVEGNRIPVDIELSPNRKNRYRIGLGYSTDTGPRMTLDWKRRRFGSKGHHMRSELRLSHPKRTLTSEYVIPLQRPVVDYLSFGATIEYFDRDTYEGNRTLLNASHSVGLERGWRRTLSLDYLYEDFIVGPQDHSARLLVPGVTWVRIKRDNSKFIYKGKRLELHLEGASDAVFSTTSYVQLYTTDKFIHGLNEDWRVLVRLELGATWVDDIRDLPPSKRFFTGGDNSVRGFGFEKLGPRDENGQVIGGSHLAVGSLELERRLTGGWSAAVFVDGGNAYNSDYRAEAAYGAGLGIRWRSPVGPIRFDLARGHYLDERNWQLHVVLGPEL